MNSKIWLLAIPPNILGNAIQNRIILRDMGLLE